MECCQKPIKDLGLQGRYEEATAKLSMKLDDMGVERIVTACPSCLAVLRERFRGREVVSCYSMIHPVENHALSPEFQKEVPAGGRLKVTVHDACSDRGFAVVGPEVRRLLAGAQGVEMVEMIHNGNNSICCGSGGLVAATDPKLASDFNRRRIAEAENSGAGLMVAYCATCVNAFRMGGNPSKVETRHALELLLGVREDYDAVALRIDELFVSGPKKDFYERLIQNSP
jgi:Fe-S oxidoreductase